MPGIQAARGPFRTRPHRRRDGTMNETAMQGVRVIGQGQTYVGKQGFTYGAGASAKTVGAKHICMSILPMPRGAQAKVHYHEGIETIAYVLEGECTVHYGDHLEGRVSVRTGKQIYIPANVPHAPRNESGAPCTCIVVHSAGTDQEGIVFVPELDAVLASKPQSV